MAAPQDVQLQTQQVIPQSLADTLIALYDNLLNATKVFYPRQTTIIIRYANNQITVGNMGKYGSFQAIYHDTTHGRNINVFNPLQIGVLVTSVNEVDGRIRHDHPTYTKSWMIHMNGKELTICQNKLGTMGRERCRLYQTVNMV